VLTDEMGSLFRGWESVGGRIYVTNRRVIFESHGLNIQRGNTEIPLEEIVEARRRNTLFIISNGMEIETREGRLYRFVVWTRARVIDMIAVCKSGKVWGAQRTTGPTGRHAADPPVDSARISR
jgi:hypothetical protein